MYINFVIPSDNDYITAGAVAANPGVIANFRISFPIIQIRFAADTV
jgi:hypothetical protein